MKQPDLKIFAPHLPGDELTEILGSLQTLHDESSDAIPTISLAAQVLIFRKLDAIEQRLDSITAPGPAGQLSGADRGDDETT